MKRQSEIEKAAGEFRPSPAAFSQPPHKEYEMTYRENSKFPVVFQGEIGGDKIQTVNARDLHAFLEVGKDFSNWVKDRIDQYDFVENQDFVCSPISASNGRGGHNRKEYHVSIDMAKELAMVERNEKGKQARLYFIECEKRAKDPMAALNDPAAMRGLLLTYSERVIVLEAKVEQSKPKAEFFDKFANADGNYTLQNCGRILTGFPNKFIRELKKEHLFYQGTALVPYAKYRQQGLFEVKVDLVDDKPRTQTLVTPKGLQYFADKFGSEARI